MTRAEFAEMVAGLVARKEITLLDASRLLHSFVIGNIARASLPLPLKDLPGRLSKEDFKQVLRGAAAQLTPLEGRKLLSTEPLTGATKPTPPEVKEFLRERLRNKLRGDYEGRMRRYASALHAGGDIPGWHKAMYREQRSYIARQMTAGVGRALTVEDMDEVNRLAARQGQYLNRFASQVSVRRIEGRPFSLKYLVARHLQYGGMGWGAWFRGNLKATARGQGYVIEYVAQDDERTCGPCSQAQANGPYLPGSSNIPYPGEVCLGHGLCRCQHRIVYNVKAWRRLMGLPEDDTLERERQEETERLAREERLAEKVRVDLLKREAQRPPEPEPVAPPIKPTILSVYADWRAKVGEIPEDGISKVRKYLSGSWREEDVFRPDKQYFSQAETLKQLAREAIEQNRLLVREARNAGMAQSEDMAGAAFDGVEFRWSQDNEMAMVNTLTRMYLQDIAGLTMPQALWEANKTIYLTTQRNKDDDYWAKKYNMPGFMATATGGYGEITVYNGSWLGIATLTHESGHNLASELYGQPDPVGVPVIIEEDVKFLESEWQKVMSQETKPVSSYGAVHPQEDFAESFSEYSTAREAFKQSHPLRYALVEKILAGKGEQEIRAARADLIQELEMSKADHRASLKVSLEKAQAQRLLAEQEAKQREAQALTNVRLSYFDAFADLDEPIDWQNIRALEGVKAAPTQLLIKRMYRNALKEWLDTNKTDEMTTVAGGMPAAQRMSQVYINGSEVWWSQDAELALLDTLIDLYASQKTGGILPEMLWDMTQGIYFTEQKNKWDEQWAVRYRMPGYKALASAGNGVVTVYNAEPVSLATITHEAAHNLARVLYGQSNPTFTGPEEDRTEWYRMALQPDEKPVRKYGETEPAEDFATAFERYSESPEEMAKSHPRRFELVDKIIKGQGEDFARSLAGERFATLERDKAHREAQALLKNPKAVQERESAEREAQEATDRALREELERLRLQGEEEERQRQADIERRREERARRRREIEEEEQRERQQGQTPAFETGDQALPDMSQPRMQTADHIELDRRSQEWAKKLTDAQKESVRKWSRDWRDTRDKISRGEIGPEEQTLLDALQEAPKVKGIVYRGVNPGGAFTSVQDVLDRYRRGVGTEIEWDTLNSSSIAPDIAAAFGNTIFEVKTKTARYMNSLSKYAGKQDDEFEALLMPGTKFRIISVGKAPIEFLDGPQDRWVIQLEEI